jgi:hypothetical protein
LQDYIPTSEDLSIRVCSLGLTFDVEDCADAGNKVFEWEADRPKMRCPGKRRRSGFMPSIAPVINCLAPAKNVVDVTLPEAGKVSISLNYYKYNRYI